MARGDVSDAEWALIEPFLPVGASGPFPENLRAQFDGVLWRFRTGSPWRDLPGRYGNFSTVFGKFRGWALAGVFQLLMDGLIAEAAARGQVDMHLVSVDSTVVRAHQDAAGMAMRREILDGLTAALTEEKGVALSQQENTRLMLLRTSPRPDSTRSRRDARRRARSGIGSRPVTRLPGSDAPRAG